MSIINGVVLLGKFGQKRAEGGGGCGRVSEGLAELEIKVHPFVVFGAIGLGNLCLFKTSFETGGPFCRKVYHWKTKMFFLEWVDYH
jgi:hypothetical protein